MTVVSGVPDDMITYGDRVTTFDLELQRKGYHLEEVLSKVRGMDGAPYVPALGDQLSTYGKKYLPVDGKVRAVGHALLNAATAGALPVDRKDPGYLPSVGGSVVTMDSAKLDPFLRTAQQQEAALERSEESVEAGQQLADDMNDAILNHDWDRVRQLAQQLADHKDDQDFTAAFFNVLGPKNALQVAWQIRKSNDDNLMAAFDEALASASNSPDIDPNFIRGLFDEKNKPDGQLVGREWIAFTGNLLLGNGKFSPDFLRAAGDLFLGDQANSWGMTVQADLFIRALDRNPEFAYFYMTEDVGDGQTRLASLMGERSFTWNGGPIADDLGVLVESMGKLGQLPRDTIFHIIAKADTGSSYNIPDGVRRAVFDLLTQQPDPRSSVPYDLLGDFTSLSQLTTPDGKPEFSAEELERLFGLAEYDMNGHADKAHIDALRTAIVQWSHDHRPSSNPVDDVDWYDHVGQLMALWAGPQRDAAHSEAERAHLEHVMIGTLTAVVGASVLAIPGVGEAITAGGVAGVGSILSGAVAAGQEAADQNTSSQLSESMRRLYELTVGTARTQVVTDALATDPSLIPDSIRSQGSHAIQGYINLVAGATDPESMLQWKVNGHPVFTGPNDPQYKHVDDLRSRLEAMQSNIDKTFLEFND